MSIFVCRFISHGVVFLKMPVAASMGSMEMFGKQNTGFIKSVVPCGGCSGYCESFKEKLTHKMA